jgi:hypothetical protein
MINLFVITDECQQHFDLGPMKRSMSQGPKDKFGSFQKIERAETVKRGGGKKIGRAAARPNPQRYKAVPW